MTENLYESINVEFKQEWKDEYLKVISSFANSVGGTLFIGKDDNGKDIGIQNFKKLLEILPNKIYSKLGIVVDIRAIGEKKKILVIDIKKSPIPISCSGHFYVRSGSVVLELQGQRLSDFLLRKTNNSWDNISCPEMVIEDIDLETIELFKVLAKDRLPLIMSEKNPVKILKKLDLISGDKIFKRATMLLFGKKTNRYFPQAKIKIGRFISDTEIVGSDIIEGNLFQQIIQAIEILKKKYLINIFVYDGIHRQEKATYPLNALREGLINAIIHRTYNSTAVTQIRIYDNKLMILNDGRLPLELTLEDLKENHISKPRNPILADIFYKAGYIESWGSGTLKIIDECKKHRLPEPKFSQKGGAFILTLRDVTKDVTKNVTKDVTKNVTKDERFKYIIESINNSPKITIEKIAKNLDVNIRTIKRDFSELKKRNIIKRIGDKKNGYWSFIDGETEI